MSGLDLGALGIGLASLTAVFSITPDRLERRYSFLLAAAVLLLLFLPLGGIPGAGYLRGLVSDLSVTSMALLGARGVELAGGPGLPARERSLLLAILAVVALGLYPMALGLTGLDPYALGFGSEGLVLAFTLLAVTAAIAGLRLLPLTVVLALAAWSLRLGESHNLWDYWIDPLVALFALGSSLRRFTNFVPLSKSR